MIPLPAVLPQEKQYLRELACQQAEIAALPIMEQRAAHWYAHNDLLGSTPMIFMEVNFEEDFMPPLRCASPAAAQIERSLLLNILHHRLIGDDMVIPGYFVVPWQISIDEFGVDIPREHADDGSGRHVGFRWQHPIRTLKEDFSKLQPAKFGVDREGTFAMRDLVSDVLGDILPVRIENHSFTWHTALSEKAVRLMGMERMLLSLIDEPEEMHALFAYLRDNILAFARWQEREGLLTLNNGNHYAGSGSYGFTRELPRSEVYAQSQAITNRDLWLNMNSQETVGISARMYREFMFPYYRDIAAEWGLVYYGCCEPVHAIWDGCVSRYPNLRKVSISPWCDEDIMGEALRGSRVIYCRKPSPNFIGVGKDLDEEAFREHIRKTLRAARGCHLEISFRDIYTLGGNLGKLSRAVEITRQLVNDLWQL